MTKVSESGHVKNVTNLTELTFFVGGYKEVYNPSKPAIRYDALQSLNVVCQDALVKVSDAKAKYSTAIADRKVTFAPLDKMSTRSLNSLKSTGTTEELDEKATSLVRKIHGRRATAKKDVMDAAVSGSETSEAKQISSSQLSYDSKLVNFSNLIGLYAIISEYAPNEEDLKLDSLKAYMAELKAKNQAVLSALVMLSNARIARNDLFYKPISGLVDISLDTKNYIKSIFGASSPQFKQVSRLMFKNIGH